MSGKRIFDLSMAVLLAPVATIIILLLMLAIAFETKGGPLFVQRRVGLNQRTFNLIKLRTMYFGTRDCPSHEIPTAQITKVGRFLRSTKLDELPQIWNIFLGDMSFVGPRPCLPSQRELVAERQARGVYSVRPGITGSAQLAGIDMSDPRKLAIADAEYIANSSWQRDLKIIFATAFGKGSGDAATRES